jgi:hypothetical protein
MGPIVHTKGWSGSPQMGPKYSGGAPGGLCPQTCALEYSDRCSLASTYRVTPRRRLRLRKGG